MRPDRLMVSGTVRTPDGFGYFIGPLRPHSGMALVHFGDGSKALYDPKTVHVASLFGIALASQQAAQVERLLNAPAVPRIGD